MERLAEAVVGEIDIHSQKYNFSVNHNIETWHTTKTLIDCLHWVLTSSAT